MTAARGNTNRVCSVEDRDYIVALRNAAPELFAELEQARERIRELEAENKRLLKLRELDEL